MKKVLLSGATGRMGTEIAKLLEKDKDLKFGTGLGLGKASGIKNKLSDVSPNDIDVVVDFSSPEFALELAAWCSKYKKPMVSGTTGFTEGNFKKFQKYSKKNPLLYASNTSVGVAVLRKVLKALASIPNFDFQIVEAHHNKKKDAPSGTAKTLQEDLEKIVGRKLTQPVSIRGGGIVGIHHVLAMGEEEVLEFSHTAHNRAVFARGALECARFLVKQKPGLYSMEDVLDGRQ